VELSYQQLLDVLRIFESSAGPNEVRRTARISIRRNITIITDPQADDARLEVVLQDISRGGVRITYHEAFARDKKFWLLLPSPGGELTVPCTVLHCEMIKQHLFRIGAQFEAASNESP
jgi:hypothetical protein